MSEISSRNIAFLHGAKLTLTLTRFLIAALLVPLAWAQVVYLPTAPSSNQIRSAKAALDHGSIIATELPNAAKFASIFNFPLPALASGHRPKPPCIIAAHKDANGQLRTFLGSNAGWQPALTGACRSSFDTWVIQQANLQSTLITGWTYMNDLSPGPQYSNQNNQVEVKGSIYRANSTDLSNDYYLVTLSGSATPSSGWQPSVLQFQVAAVASNGQLYPPFAYGPDVLQTNFTLGAAIPYSPDVVGTYQRSGLNAPTVVANGFDVLDWEYYSQYGQNAAAVSETAVIFQVPAGVSHFVVKLYGGAVFVSDAGSDELSYEPLIAITTPFLSVPAESYVIQGQSAKIAVSASRYIAWTLTGLPTFTTQDSDSGTGTGTFQFSVNSDAPIGTSGDFSFNTSPPSATPQVPQYPIAATVYVNQTLPPSGVLLAGGTDWNGNTVSTAQIWDPTTGTVNPTNYPMVQARSQHTGTLILSGANTPNNGKVLIAGGFDSNGTPLATTELYDPVTQQFTAGPTMTSAHAVHCAVRLNDGTILIIGGVDSQNATAVVDIYNPITNTFSTTPMQLVKARQNFSATVLQDGSVLVAGGSPGYGNINSFSDAELYAAGAASFGPIPTAMTSARQAQAAVMLANGQVGIFGGFAPCGGSCDPLTTAELYTESSAQPFIATTGTLAPGRRYPAAVDYTIPNAPNDAVAIFGGYNAANGITTYDTADESFTNNTSMQEARDHPTAVLIQGTNTTYDGEILVAGGVLPQTGTSNGTLVEVYDPVHQTVSGGGTMNTARSGLSTTLFGLNTRSLPAQRRTQQ